LPRTHDLQSAQPSAPGQKALTFKIRHDLLPRRQMCEAYRHIFGDKLAV
jgi:hypothetical protein